MVLRRNLLHLQDRGALAEAGQSPALCWEEEVEPTLCTQKAPGSPTHTLLVIPCLNRWRTAASQCWPS